MMVDLLTSPPSSTAPSPSLVSLAAIPSLAPSIINPLLRQSANITFSATARRTSFVPPTDNALGLSIPYELELPIPSADRALTANTLARASHSDANSDNLHPALQALVPRPSLPAIVPILNVTIGQDPTRPNQLRRPSFQIDLPSPTSLSTPLPPPVITKTLRPALAVHQGGTSDIDENDARRSSRSSSYVRTPYPAEEGLDYMEHLSVSMRRAHPCDRAEDTDTIRWTDPWAPTRVSSEQGDAEDSDGTSLLGPGEHANDEGFGGYQAGEAAKTGTMSLRDGTVSKSVKEGASASGASKVRVGSKDKVEVMDVSNWASVGMEQAWSADSQSAVEGDSLLVAG